MLYPVSWAGGVEYAPGLCRAAPHLGSNAVKYPRKHRGDRKPGNQILRDSGAVLISFSTRFDIAIRPADREARRSGMKRRRDCVCHSGQALWIGGQPSLAAALTFGVVLV